MVRIALVYADEPRLDRGLKELVVEALRPQPPHNGLYETKFRIAKGSSSTPNFFLQTRPTNTIPNMVLLAINVKFKHLTRRRRCGWVILTPGDPRCNNHYATSQNIFPKGLP